MNKVCLFVFMILMSPNGGAMIVDDLKNKDDREWVYFTDTVMGGVSRGKLEYLEKDDEKFYRMTGIVSTENNGGFIQFATGIKGVNDDFKGIKIRVRGNNENYQIHLRTRYTPAPWQYYSVEFSVDTSWKDILLPFSEFKKSNFYQTKSFSPSTLRSIGIVAVGKDFEAEIDLSRIELY